MLPPSPVSQVRYIQTIRRTPIFLPNWGRGECVLESKKYGTPKSSLLNLLLSVLQGCMDTVCQTSPASCLCSLGWPGVGQS